MKSNTIILSIHPKHIEKILSGEKQYEYRKRIPLSIDHLIIYATSPIKKVVAVIKIDTILKNTPQNIWELTNHHSGISYDFFMKYFTGTADAYAIKFRDIYKLPQPVDITTIENIKCAPQAYTYVNESIKDICYKFGINEE